MVNGTRARINADRILNEPHGGIRFGTDALLLSWAAYDAAAGKKRVLDIGTGSGVIPLLLLGAGSRSHFTGLEIQPEYASAANENAAQNGFSARFTAICGSAGDAAALFPAGGFDVVVTNPPYMRADCGYVNTSHALSVARREESGGIAMFCTAAAHCLKSGGKFFAVYRPDRLSHLLCSMSENGIEPKEINPLQKAFMWSGIKMKTLTDKSRNRIAELMIKGTVTGITELTAMKNEKGNFSEETVAFIEDLLTLEESYEKKLKKYL